MSPAVLGIGPYRLFFLATKGQSHPTFHCQEGRKLTLADGRRGCLGGSPRYHLSMGLAHATVTVRSLNGEEGSYTGSFLVDSGATDSLVSRGELQSIGITPEDAVVYELADGTRHSYEIGFARFTVQGATRVGSVIFGPEGVEPILGVTILESAGLMIDPVTQTLKKLPAVPLKTLGVVGLESCGYRLPEASDIKASKLSCGMIKQR